MVGEQYLQNILFQKQAIFIPKNYYTDDDYEKFIKFQPVMSIIKTWGGEDLDEVFFPVPRPKGQQ